MILMILIMIIMKEIIIMCNNINNEWINNEMKMRNK